MMRYTLYCGEPVPVGGFRTWPGPAAWTVWYAVLDLGNSIFPYNSANAAVPLAAMIIGHLPGDGSVPVLGVVLSETQLVKLLGFVIFLAAFVPLIFGGTVYRMLEVLKKGSGTFCAQHPSGRSGKMYLTPFSKRVQQHEQPDLGAEVFRIGCRP